jgi:hypothetical protein
LFGQMKKGDPVEYTGSSRPIEQGNGWTDWNIAWDEWVTKSALKVAPTPSATTPPASPSSSGTPTIAPPSAGGSTTLPNGIRITD